jgi:hypothetical protein
MVRSGIKPGEIIARIVTSPCIFDIFPPVLNDLRRRGVPDTVVLAMVMVPTGPPNFATASDELPPTTAKVKIPSGTEVELETVYPVSSAVIESGSEITFVVARPVFVKGLMAIAPGAVAKARVMKVRKAQVLGRGGALAWRMEYVVAVDGTHIPIELSNRSEGANRSGAVAAGAALTTALVFPYSAPVAMVWAFKKGDDAILRGSKRFAAKVSGDTNAVGMIPEQDRVIYHYADALKANAATTTFTAFPRQSVRRGSYP